MNIERARARDWSEIRRIYESGIATGHATFAVSPPDTWREWSQSRIADCCLVARREGTIVGWASLERASERKVYAGVAIVNIYVSPGAQGRGVGAALMEELVRSAEAQGIWTLEARIFPENRTSIRLHEKLGFRRVGTRRKLGRMEYGPLAGRWRDVVLLERRSTVAGVD